MDNEKDSVIGHADRLSSEKAARKEEVEKALRTLRNNNALVIHMWEGDPCLFPKKTLKVLSKVPAEEIPRQMLKGHIPYVSVSLLPDDRSGKSMRPYEEYQSTFKAPGYLLNFSSRVPHPAKVIMASPDNIESGDNHYTKLSKLLLECKIPQLNEFYNRMGSINMLVKTIAEEKGSTLTRMQLNALGKYYTDNPIHLPSSAPCPNNEVIAATSREHIVAIAIAAYTNRGPWDRPMTELTAALAGLKHLQEGMDYPVVLYNVAARDGDSPPSYRQGDCTYLGQGKQELLKVAVKALHALESTGMNPAIFENKEYGYRDMLVLEAVSQTAKSILHIDMHKPLANQTEALIALQKQIETSAIETPQARSWSGLRKRITNFVQH